MDPLERIQYVSSSSSATGAAAATTAAAATAVIVSPMMRIDARQPIFVGRGWNQVAGDSEGRLWEVWARRTWVKV